MSVATFWIRHNDKVRRAYPLEYGDFVITDGKFRLSVTKSGFMIEEFQLDVSFNDIVSMNTEAGYWLESHGMKVPETAVVRATGYGATEKQSYWDKEHDAKG